MPWVEMMRDMTAYKYADIYLLLSDADREQTERLFERARELGTEKICAFAVIETSRLFKLDNSYAAAAAEEILKDDPEFIRTVISPNDKKKYIFTEKDIVKRFFAKNRKVLLKEAGSIENA